MIRQLRDLGTRVACVVVLSCGLSLAQSAPAPTPAAGASADDRFAGSYRHFAPTGPNLDPALYADSAARAAVTDRAQALAELTVNTLPIIKRVEFEESADYRKAQLDLKQAHEAYEEARRRVIAGVAQTDADYRVAAAEIERLARILAAGSLSPRERLDLASRKMSYAAIASRIEAEALESDSRYKDARGKMLAAASKVSEMKAAFESALRKDTEFVAARKQLAAARLEATAASAYHNALHSVYGQLIDAYYYSNRDRYGQPYWGCNPYPYNYYPYGSTLIRY